MHFTHADYYPALERSEVMTYFPGIKYFLASEETICAVWLVVCYSMTLKMSRISFAVDVDSYGEPR